ncbi:unnamed protein product [Adineta ricciae]|uniref:UDENN FNIP1/2-type domain-containing protein n=1 Tax=Adineta ricciae TaxID=249248 RepID=A0A814JG58_ADIRI|nr:unnamed protein product [Adineta ricciae]CAF1142956.1 unnamed protein product [Adineta ricciae]
MASFISRVFGKTTSSSSSKKNATPSINSPIQLSNSTAPIALLDLPQWVPPEFNRDSIRLLVFFDSDDTGLQIIFDSKTLRIVPPIDNENSGARTSTTVNPYATASGISSTMNSASKPPAGPGGARARPAITRFTHKGKQYELLKASNDTRSYADYIFGTMPLLHKGTGMKIHTSKSPLQIMMSRVFAMKAADRPDTLANISVTSEPDSAPVNPLNPFILPGFGRSSSSGVSVASSTISSIDVLGEDLTAQKFGRLYRRWLKFTNRTMKQHPRQPGRRHRRCIGAAFMVMFHPDDTAKYKHFEEFFCTHAPLIENHFQKIMATAEANIHDRNAVAAALLEKLFVFRDDIHTLYTRPRLLYPAWYMLTQEQLTMSKRRALAQQLCSIIDLFTTPKYGDFLNCVLSAVLSYQLSWLSTVSPSLTKSKQQVSFKAKADYVHSLQNFLQYSPLWGQLIDLFSAYSQPPYICRTVLVGSDSSLLTRLIYLLSFFIRPSYLTYTIPNSNLSDHHDEQNRSYKKIRLYIDELIAESTQIQDIEPYSPVHSIHDETEEQNFEDDIDILSGDESAHDNNTTTTTNQTTSLAEPKEFYQLTFTSDDLESTSVDEHEISLLLDSLVMHIDQIIINESRAKLQSPVNSVGTVRVTTASPVKPIVNSPPSKILMSLPLFEPNHLGHEPIHINNDYHIDLALSLISSVSKSYSPDFILQAIETSHVNDIIHSICTQHASDISETGGLFLDGEQIDTSITILINIDDLTVNLYSSKHNDVARRQERTTLIQPLIDNAHLAKQLLPADFVLLNMEDSLQEIYFQALAILKYMKANNNSAYSQESVSSFGDSASTTSMASGDTDDKNSRATGHTITDLSPQPLTNPSMTSESLYATAIDNSSELVQNVLRRFQLQRSDYMFLKNILRVLETEQLQVID